MRLRYLLTPTRRNAEATKWFIFGVSNFCLQIIYRCYVSPLGGYNRLLSWLDAAVGAVQASQAGARRRYTFDRPSAAIGTTNAVPGRPDRRRYVVIGDKNSYLESCTITRCGCVGSTCRATVAPNTEEMEDLMTHLPERAHTEPAHLVACTTVDDLFIRCRAMDLKRW